MRAVVGRTGLDRQAASTSQMGRFKVDWLTSEANVAALADLSSDWLDRMPARRPRTIIVLDMDSSVSKTHGARKGHAYNGHCGCTCYHPLFLFNQFGYLERDRPSVADDHVPDSRGDGLARVVSADTRRHRGIPPLRGRLFHRRSHTTRLLRRQLGSHFGVNFH